MKSRQHLNVNLVSFVKFYVKTFICNFLGLSAQSVTEINNIVVQECATFWVIYLFIAHFHFFFTDFFFGFSIFMAFSLKILMYSKITKFGSN